MTTTQTNNFNPNNPTTTRAWAAITRHLRERQHLDLWGHRTTALAKARVYGLTEHQANHLVDQAIAHGHLEHDTQSGQIRLTPEAARG